MMKDRTHTVLCKDLEYVFEFSDDANERCDISGMPVEVAFSVLYDLLCIHHNAACIKSLIAKLPDAKA